jgi:hypothetical protein
MRLIFPRKAQKTRKRRSIFDFREKNQTLTACFPIFVDDLNYLRNIN